MKYQFKQGLSMMLVLVMLISLLSGLTITVDAAATYKYNQGQRGVVATSLTSAAEDFYAANGVTYETMSALSGSSTLSSVPSSALYKELQSLMKRNHKTITSYADTRDMYRYTDCQNGGGKISSFYSGKEIGPDWDGGSTWNREHTWPNSKGLAGDDENDIMMLRPTSSQENSSRGNKAYGQSSGYYNPNSESGGKYDLRGDVARIFLYVYTRWGNVNGNGEYTTWGSTGVMESKEVLLSWMEIDPVDTWELGRNDSVESITGTRNVFVDYPELAFLLFGEEVPTNMSTPSGKAGEVYKITATVNDSKMGTVSVSGNNINAVPATGYLVSGYEVVSGEATVTRDGNAFKVTASSDCTIRILFEAKAKVTLTYKNNTTVVSTETVYSGDTITLPDYTGEVPEGYTFVGWTEETVDHVDRQPEYTESGEDYFVTGETDLYALFSYVVEGEGGPGTWVQVTSSNMLTAGAQIVLAETTKGAVATSFSSTYLSVVENVKFSADNSTIPVLPQNAMIFTLGGKADAWTLTNSSGQKLGATGLKKLSFTGGTTTWSIVISNNSAIIRSGTFDYGEILYNPGSPRFTTYNPNTYTGGLQPQLYMLSDGETTYYTTIIGQIPPQPEVPTPTIDAVVDDSTMGTVSVSDNVITAVPAEGYLVSGYEVVRGTAIVTREDDTFMVDASNDCTIRIIFEAKKPEVTNRCPLCVMAEKNPLFRRHVHIRPRNP